MSIPHAQSRVRSYVPPPASTRHAPAAGPNGRLALRVRGIHGAIRAQRLNCPESIAVGTRPVGCQCGNECFRLGSEPCIPTLRCKFVRKCVFSWPFVMRSYYRRVFPNLTRIRTMADAYRDAYLYKGGRWNDLESSAAFDGMSWRTHGLVC